MVPYVQNLISCLFSDAMFGHSELYQEMKYVGCSVTLFIWAVITIIDNCLNLLYKLTKYLLLNT